MAQNITERIGSTVAEVQYRSINERSGTMLVSSYCYYCIPLFSESAMCHIHFLFI